MGEQLEDYLDGLPVERKQAVEALRALILETVPEAEETFRLNCGKGCIRFKKLDDLPFETARAILRETYAKNQHQVDSLES